MNEFNNERRKLMEEGNSDQYQTTNNSNQANFYEKRLSEIIRKLIEQYKHEMEVLISETLPNNDDAEEYSYSMHMEATALFNIYSIVYLEENTPKAKVVPLFKLRATN